MGEKVMSKEREEESLGLGLFTEDEIESAQARPKGKPIETEPKEERKEEEQKKARPKTKTTAKEKEPTKDRRLEDDGQLKLFGISRRGGARPGAGRPRGNKHPWSLRVTEEEKTALKSMLAAMRGQ